MYAISKHVHFYAAVETPTPRLYTIHSSAPYSVNRSSLSMGPGPRSRGNNGHLTRRHVVADHTALSTQAPTGRLSNFLFSPHPTERQGLSGAFFLVSAMLVIPMPSSFMWAPTSPWPPVAVVDLLACAKRDSG